MPLQAPLDLGFLEELSGYRWITDKVCITIIDEASPYAAVPHDSFYADLAQLRATLSSTRVQVGCMELKSRPSSLLTPVGVPFPSEVHRWVSQRPSIEDWDMLLQSMRSMPKRVLLSCDASGSTNGFGDSRIRVSLFAWIAQLENRGVTVITREYQDERWLRQLVKDISENSA
ncbi:hypothetical protein Mmc1_2558 [Magnetococcus marinus MC-1]|uniref:Uncharacterized protein n=1 Tax=Magnetococcus marinus (strain ATCC BAA-1437 / JCM 17883 / MC-1) TaxID=156889 RepID=A0LAR4_MAGMM|nr:hypothetical protein [Magnetococcus marinus]ABK45057.1 hypothetical protein Mmc1_2558 [Magnetococcus marinus MC-1]